MLSFDSYYAKTLAQSAMIQIRSKILNAPRHKHAIRAPRSDKQELAWAEEELQKALKKFDRYEGADQLTDIFWAEFEKKIKNDRYM